jgi:formylglycine-generating enzyme required for sulfatase activity
LIAPVKAAPLLSGSLDMKWIPGGEFTMGTDDEVSMPNERPAHRVKVAGFWIDAHAVTNDEFGKFVDSTGYLTTAERPIDWNELKKQLPPGAARPSDKDLEPGALVFNPPSHPVELSNMSNWWRWTAGANWRHPRGPESDIRDRTNHPVVQVSWDDAVAFCRWKNKRLPTEAEWEFAARGGSPKNTRYIWGDEFKMNGKFMANTFTGDFPYRNTAEDGFAGAAPVKSFPPNGYGLYDMAGNVWNWCSDFYSAVAHTEASSDAVSCDPAGPTKTFSPHDPLAIEHVTKGGSFLCNPDYCESYRPTARRGTPYDTGMEHIGFRCAVSEGSQSMNRN